MIAAIAGVISITGRPGHCHTSREDELMPTGPQENANPAVSRYNHIVEARDGSGLLVFKSSTGAMIKVAHRLAQLIIEGAAQNLHHSVVEQLCAG